MRGSARARCFRKRCAGPAHARQHGAQRHAKVLAVSWCVSSPTTTNRSDSRNSVGSWERACCISSVNSFVVGSAAVTGTSSGPSPTSTIRRPARRQRSITRLRRIAASHARWPRPHSKFARLFHALRSVSCTTSSASCAVAHQAVSDAIQCRSMVVDQDNKVCPRKRHPCLSVSLFRVITGGCGRDALYHMPVIDLSFRGSSHGLFPPGEKIVPTFVASVVATSCDK